MTDKPHLKIYLQCCDEDGVYIGREPGAEVTWCQDQINRHDVEYILASEFYALHQAHDNREAKLTALREQLENRKTALSICQRDLAALKAERDALRDALEQLEDAVQKMVYHFDVGVGNTPEEQAAIDRAVHLVRLRRTQKATAQPEGEGA